MKLSTSTNTGLDNSLSSFVLKGAGKLFPLVYDISYAKATKYEWGGSPPKDLFSIDQYKLKSMLSTNIIPPNSWIHADIEQAPDGHAGAVNIPYVNPTRYPVDAANYFAAYVGKIRVIRPDARIKFWFNNTWIDKELGLQSFKLMVDGAYKYCDAVSFEAYPETNPPSDPNRWERRLKQAVKTSRNLMPHMPIHIMYTGARSWVEMKEHYHLFEILGVEEVTYWTPAKTPNVPWWVGSLLVSKYLERG
jgi:hypothetical protein